MSRGTIEQVTYLFIKFDIVRLEHFRDVPSAEVILINCLTVAFVLLSFPPCRLGKRSGGARNIIKRNWYIFAVSNFF